MLAAAVHASELRLQAHRRASAGWQAARAGTPSGAHLLPLPLVKLLLGGRRQGRPQSKRARLGREATRQQAG